MEGNQDPQLEKLRAETEILRAEAGKFRTETANFNERARAEHNRFLVSHLAPILTALILAGTLAFQFYQFRETSQLQTYQFRETSQFQARQSRAERFDKAVKLLWEKEPQLSAGAIYALEQIVEDSETPSYHRQTMEILAAYIRELATLEKPRRKSRLAPADIQAALTVIARRKITKDDPKQRLWLRQTDLSGIFLDGLEAQLAGPVVSLADARLEWAHLRGAHLEKVNLGGADLSHAYLDGAHLENAELGEGACLLKTSFEGAYLQGANMVGAIRLTQEQINSAIINSSTKFRIPTTHEKDCP